MWHIFAETIYRTPENWGEETIADRRAMGEIIDSLYELGADWQDCDLTDCDEFSLVRAVPNMAIYQRANVRRPEYFIFGVPDGGFYRMVRLPALGGGTYPAVFVSIDSVVEEFPELAA